MVYLYFLYHYNGDHQSFELAHLNQMFYISLKIIGQNQLRKYYV